MYRYHSELLTENEQNVNQRLSLPPPHWCLSSSQPTQEQGTAGRRTMCEGHLTKQVGGGVVLSLALATRLLSSMCG